MCEVTISKAMLSTLFKELDNMMYAQNGSVMIEILIPGDDNDDSDDHREILKTFNFRQGFYELQTIIFNV